MTNFEVNNFKQFFVLIIPSIIWGITNPLIKIGSANYNSKLKENIKNNKENIQNRKNNYKTQITQFKTQRNKIINEKLHS